MRTKQEIQRLIKEDLARHHSMRTVDGLERVLERFYGIPNIEKLKCRERYSGSGPVKRIRLSRDPEIRGGLIAKFNSTNATAVFGIVPKKGTDLLTLLQDIEFAFQNHKDVQEIVFSKELRQLFEQEKEEKVVESEEEYQDYDWFKTRWQELRQEEGISEWDASRRIAQECGVHFLEIYNKWYPKHVAYAQEIGDIDWLQEKGEDERPREKVTLKEKYHPAYLLLYNASDEIAEDGEHFKVRGAFSLLKKEFGEQKAESYYAALKNAGILVPEDPKARGTTKPFLLKDIPELTSRPLKEKEEAEAPKVALPKEVLSRLTQVEEGLARLTETSKFLSPDTLRDMLKELVKEMTPEIAGKAKVQPQSAKDLFRLVTSLLISCLEDLRVYIPIAKLLAQRLPEEEKKQFEELIAQVPPEFLEETG